MSKNSTATTTGDPKLTTADRARLEAYCSLELADYHKALAPARRAVKLSTDHAPSEAILALSLRGIGKFHEALIHAEKAHELAPDEPEYAFVHGLCLWFSQADNEALQMMRSAIDKLPQRFDMRLDYAGFLLQQQRFDEALEQAELAATLAPNNSKAKIVCKCARAHSWSKIIDQLASTPPLPITGAPSFTYATIAAAHLNANGFELAMNKCSHALDIDINYAKAKGVYCTAHYLKEHDFAGLCHDFSNKMKKWQYRFFILLLPLIGLMLHSLYFYSHQNNRSAIICAVALVAYLLIYFILQVSGDVRISPKKFEEIVRSEHLTPQGRPQHIGAVRNELDEVIDDKSSPTDTNDSLTEIANQIERHSKRLQTLSTTYSALAILGLAALLGTIVIQSNTERLGNSLIPTIQRAAGVFMIFFGICALHRRRRAEIVRQRAVEQRASLNVNE